MSITVCLFVCLFFACLYICHFVRLRIFPPGIKPAASNFARMVNGRPGHGISHSGKLCSSGSPKSDESASILKICSFQKKHRIKGAGVRTPWTPPGSAPRHPQSIFCPSRNNSVEQSTAVYELIVTSCILTIYSPDVPVKTPYYAFCMMPRYWLSSIDSIIFYFIFTFRLSCHG